MQDQRDKVFDGKTSPFSAITHLHNASELWPIPEAWLLSCYIDFFKLPITLILSCGLSIYFMRNSAKYASSPSDLSIPAQ